MKSLLRSLLSSPGRGNSLGLALVLIILVLGPSACLVWFMSQATRNERLAARQRLFDSYRAHLALAQERLDAWWRETASDLDRQASATPPAALFSTLVRSGLADSVICFDSNLLYPDNSSASTAALLAGDFPPALADLELSSPEEASAAYANIAEAATSPGIRARALQAQVRSLIKAKRNDQALALVTKSLAASRFDHASDSGGRLLTPAMELLQLELFRQCSNAIPEPILLRSKTRLLDYQTAGRMPASQRRFLLRQLHSIHPDPQLQRMLSAEDLAAEYLDTSTNRFTEPALRPTALPGVWQFASKNGRVITLHRTEALSAAQRIGTAAQLLPAGVRLALLPPGKEAETAMPSMFAGSFLPGWRLTLVPTDKHTIDNAAEQRAAAYIWVGVLVLTLIAVLAVLALGLLRRQAALTQLRNDLVANVTHELKTPLSAMRVLVDTLLDARSPDPQTVREYLQLIASENLRLSRVIDNFLAFSRMERNKQTFDLVETPAANIANAAASAVRERFQTPGCHFTVKIPANLPAINADSDALTTAVINLLDNAYKYTDDYKCIELAVDCSGSTVRFIVKDNGIGLSPRDARRIFKRFYQVAHKARRAGGGCGLGLSIVDFVVKAHGGSVRVESQPGQGSTFIIELNTSSRSETQDTSQ